MQIWMQRLQPGDTPDNTPLTSYMYMLMPISNTHTNVFVDNEGVFRATTNYLLMHIVIWCNSYAYTVFSKLVKQKICFTH